MADTDWLTWANNLAASWGLNAAIGSSIVDLVQRGFADESLVLELRKTAAYKARFPAMDTMVQRGWNESNYVSYESKMREIESSYGLPSGMLSGKDQVAKMAVDNLDEAQIEKRVKINYAAAKQVPAEVKMAMADYYGVTDPDGALTAYYLDPTRSVELLQDQLLTAQIGGAAKRQGLAIERAQAEALQQQGVSEADAQAGFQQVAMLDSATRGWGETISQEDLIAAQFGGAEQAKKAARVAQSRLAQTQGGGGAAEGQGGVFGLASSASG